MKLGNAKLILSKEGKISVDKVVNFLRKKCNINLVLSLIHI